MTAPSIIKRRLTFHFERSVNPVTGKPNTMEVVVGALSSPTSAATNTTFVDDPQSTVVVLGGTDNTCYFDLVPTDDPSLSERLLYRVYWRSSYLGKQVTYDFAMPDLDCNFDDLLGDLQQVVDWHVYLQQSDLGVPGRVAQLNMSGQVVDAAGVPITGDVAAAVVQRNLDAEVVNRQKADRDLRSSLESQLTTQYSSAQANLQTAVDRVVEGYQTADASERAVRQRLIGELSATVEALSGSTSGDIAALQAQTAQLPGKADLGPDGKLLPSQLPPISLGQAVPVADEAAMLALTAEQVQPGDFAVRPDGVWYLNEPDPSQLGSWVKFSIAPLVSSINGQSGDITLTAADVGARPAGTPLVISDTTGLQTALDAKASAASVASLTTRVSGTETRLTAIEAPTSAYVRTSNGIVPTGLLGADVPRLSGQNILVNSQGNPISVVGSGAVDSVNGHTGVVVLSATDVGARPSGTAINIVEVSGLSDALAGKVAGNDARLTNARTPISHAATHASNGSDPISAASIGARPASTAVPLADVAGLQTALDSKGALTAQNQQATRISSLETRVDSLEGGGGFGGVSAFKVEAWDAVALTTPSTVAGFAQNVVFKSPFGLSADTGGYYYNPTGAAAGEAVWPYLTPNGHLELRKWNEAAPADPALATQASVTALSTAVDGKADAATVTALQQTVALKADTSAVTTLSGQLAGKADQSTVTALTATVAAKASQASVDALSATVDGKASTTALNSLSATVDGKASTTALNSLTSRVSAVETGKASQAALDLLSTTVAGKADASALAAKAAQTDLTALTGRVSAVEAGKEALSAKNQPNGYAGLDANGKIPNAAIPALGLMNPQSTLSRQAMLSLTSVQQGDICTITAGADMGTYILNDPLATAVRPADPSVFSNWLKLATPTDLVSSVNGQVGTVVLSAGDVGARPAGVSISQSEVTGLAASLALKSDESSVASRLAAKASAADVQAAVTSSAAVKAVADYVTRTALTWPFTGAQSVDGATMTQGKVVLVNNQSDSTQNGLWTVNTTANGGVWTRSPDLPAGAYLVRGTLVLVRSGSFYANTFWQAQASGTIGTDRNNWGTEPAMQAGPPLAYSAGNGLSLSGTTYSVKPSTGITVGTAGVAVDHVLVPYKYASDVPGGSTLCTITHNLGTTDISAVTVIEKSSGDVKLLGWTVTGTNTISLEFAAAPGSNQYRVIVTA